MQFVNWEWRPAVLADDGIAAWAILAPGENWTRVDRAEVVDSGALLTEAAWREIFSARWELPPLPQIKERAP